MNILNKGRCSRCIASKKMIKVEKEDIRDLNGNITAEILKEHKWNYCIIKNNFCRSIAFNCKEPPMGISINDFNLRNLKNEK